MLEGVARGLFVWRMVSRCGWEGRRAVSSVSEDMVVTLERMKAVR